MAILSSEALLRENNPVTKCYPWWEQNQGSFRQWRIYIVKFWTPPGVQILSISCSFWENLAKSYVGAPLESWRPLLGEILDPPLLGSSYSHALLILLKSSKSKHQVVHEQEFKDLLSGTCQVSVERIVLDLESEAAWVLFPLGVTFCHLISFT